MKTPLLKVCGATTRTQVDLLAAAGANLVGLWYGVPGGRADLSLSRLADLAAAVRDTGVAEPVLVTFAHDVRLLSDAVARTGVRWLQLHAYQPPTVVRALRDALDDDVTLVKVLHLRAGACLERRLVGAYERSGTQVFLLDSLRDDGRVGSTGQPLDTRAAHDLVPQLTRPFLLAGGIQAGNRAHYAGLAAHPGLLGIDVDSAARDRHGEFDRQRVRDIARSWRTAGIGTAVPLLPRAGLALTTAEAA
jgi:phosphoribosylanthranilate isomerase